MTHQVSPTTFRVGKIFLWKNNINLPNYDLSNINSLLKHILRRRRLFIIKSTLKITLKINKIKIHVLFMPRIKTKPRPDSRGNFSKIILYKKLNWTNNSLISTSKNYIDQRRLKIYKMPQQKRFQINRWISRRMFRSSNFLPNPGNNKLFKFFKNNNFNSYIYRARVLQNLKWGYKWWYKRVQYNRQINLYAISNKTNLIVNKNTSIKLYNIFTFLAYKQIISYKSHQEHLWNKKYRQYRFFYDNYYDIINAFFILTHVKNSENLLLAILRMMMPRIRKIRKFMYFLDAVIKNMPQIQNNFLCLRITITGKIRGGTERTKTLTTGFGYLPYQSLNLEGTTAFISYPHKFGEFGIRLIMSRLFYIK